MNKAGTIIKTLLWNYVTWGYQMILAVSIISLIILNTTTVDGSTTIPPQQYDISINGARTPVQIVEFYNKQKEHCMLAVWYHASTNTNPVLICENH